MLLDIQKLALLLLTSFCIGISAQNADIRTSYTEKKTLATSIKTKTLKKRQTLRKRAYDIWKKRFPLGKYHYSVYMEGDYIGKQTLEITSPQRDVYIMKSFIDIKVSYFLFFTFYQKHHCTEVWRNGRLDKIDSWTDNNGEEFTLSLNRVRSRLLGVGKEGAIDIPNPTLTNNAWNLMAFSYQKTFTMLNPQTGETRTLQIKALANQRLRIAKEDVTCRRLKFNGTRWAFWYSSKKGSLVKQQDVLEGYDVEIIFDRLEKF